jgi:hypothetical protein
MPFSVTIPNSGLVKNDEAFMAMIEREMADMARDYELNFVFGDAAWRRYMRSFHHRDRPPGTRKVRGKSRKLAMRDLYRRAESVTAGR